MAGVAAELAIFTGTDRRPIVTPPVSLEPPILQRLATESTGVTIRRRFTAARGRGGDTCLGCGRSTGERFQTIARGSVTPASIGPADNLRKSYSLGEEL